ncbi:hypothetical protein A3C87_03230 [Candidatus Kaiserbacteria bacterium RIFCSPHIGHO2_02_FULL_49_34]|uniref:Glycosyltransferase 2-like domain-containing protein n=1 Tax=Candidatus Kaiserbacteria bacterium RIFCSPHIGHO2_02_FULL_49_34 TaxID=1798491 RepID=A0A1F6DI98_9BACT|nr:MAG: hypothetical protein A3C87_03230 [Candidatus Kaiserbacteria bacterium RIFCSPHIGHO2_02_FULL_49_34]
MNANTPLVSIMMTSYNRAGYIGEAIESVLMQTYQNWELLVLDDASTDDTVSIAQGFAEQDARVRVLPAPQNLGITGNRNRGFALARGEYIAVLDSDDMWSSSEKLAKQVAFLESNPEHILVGTQVDVIDGFSNTIGSFAYETEDAAIRAKLLLRNQFTHSAILMRKTAEIYNPAVPIWEDYDLILRLGTLGKLANLPEQMTQYRKHASNISKEKRAQHARVHLDIIWAHKDAYPHYSLAWMKAQLRILRAYV